MVLLVLYPLVLASLDLLYYNGMGWRGAVMDLTGTKMAWATLAALLPFGGHEATAMARVVDSTTLIETIFESQPQLFVQFTALCTGRLSGSTIVVGSIVVSALCTIKTLTWRVNYLFGLDSPDRGWKRTLAIAVYFASLARTHTCTHTLTHLLLYARTHARTANISIVKKYRCACVGVCDALLRIGDTMHVLTTVLTTMLPISLLCFSSPARTH